MKWTEYLKKEKEILTLFEKGMSANKICIHFKNQGIKVSPPSICKILNKNNCITGNDKYNLTQKQKDQIIDLYVNQKKSIADIQKYFNFSSNRPISKFLKQMNLEIDRRRGPRVKKINEDYFNKIDTENKAYILGYAIADACIIKCQNSLYFAMDLNSNDKYVLELIDNELNGNGKIYSNVKRNTSSISYGSKRLCESLSKYGITQKKTGKEYLPLNEIDEKFIKHLIRGFFDGDGTVFMRTDNSKLYNKRLEFGFCGNSFILQQIKDILLNELNISDNKIVVRKERSICQIMFSKYDDIINFYNYLYSETGFCLKRKKEKFDTFINLYENTEVTL